MSLSMRALRKLLPQLRKLLPTAARERGTEYNGLFSYAGEWHSAIIGLAVGLFAPYELMVFMVGVAVDEQVTVGRPALKEFRSEPWYGLGLMIVGFGARKIFFNTTLPTYSLIEILNLMSMLS